MKSGFTLYDKRDNKLEITLDGIETVTIEVGDPIDWEHTQVISVSFDDFREFLKALTREFDLQGV